MPHYGTEWEDYVDIKKSDMKSLTYDQLLLFLKNIDEKMKVALIAESNLFLMPSRIDKKSVEGFGIAFIEAGPHGIASIGGKDGGASDAIIHNQTGLICNGNDLDSIYQSIKTIFEEDRYLIFGKNAKEFSKQFEWSKIIKKYIELLN